MIYVEICCQLMLSRKTHLYRIYELGFEIVQLVEANLDHTATLLIRS